MVTDYSFFLLLWLNFCDVQFFHLITDLYKEGTAKDMKKWAYEIHSTYLVPNAVYNSHSS